MYRLVCICILLTALVSCKPDTNKSADKFEYMKKYDYRIEVSSWNEFSGINEKFILDNKGFRTPDTLNGKDIVLKPFVLYKITKGRTMIKADTVERSISKESSDSLFNITSRIFKTIELSNCDTIVNGRAQTHNYPSDNSGASVTIFYSDQILSKRVSNLSQADNSTKELENLINYFGNLSRQTN